MIMSANLIHDSIGLLISATFINQKKTLKVKTEIFPIMFLYDAQRLHKKTVSLGFTSSKYWPTSYISIGKATSSFWLKTATFGSEWQLLGHTGNLYVKPPFG